MGSDGAPAAPASGAPAVAMRGITKRFGAVIANDRIDFDLAPGEIHALLGENGSGKTTLMSILYGLYRPEEGTIELAGRAFAPRRPLEAMAHGIGMIPQRFRLVPTLTVAENVALGLDARGCRHTALLREVRARLKDLGRDYGLQIDPAARIERLSMGERQRVEILRALYHESRILLMDEPTSVLTPGEVEGLFKMIQRMARAEQRTVVLVTHKLREAVALADRMTVLRQGRRIATFAAAGVTPERLVEAMMGERSPADKLASRRSPRGTGGADWSPSSGRAPVLSVESLSVAPEQGAGLVAGALAAVSFEVAGGEIYGIAGVEGNGQRELELALAGVIAPVAGSIRVLGAPIAEQRTRVAYIPSDGQQWGIVRDLSVAENLLLREIAAGPALAIAATRRPGAGVTVERDIARFNVVPPNPSLLAKRLSGGNAQKLLLARELGRAPALIVAAQPTIGLDVASAAFVRAALRRAAEEGAAVLVISSDLDELFELANRIGVMYHGAMQGEWEAAAASLVALGAAMAGMTVRQPSASG